MIRQHTLLLLLALAAGTPIASAIDNLTFGLARLTGDRWTIEALRVQLNLASEESGTGPFTIGIGRIEHPALPGPLLDTRLDCLEGSISPEAIDCPRAVVRIQHPALAKIDIKVSFYWNNVKNIIEINSKSISLDSGMLALSFRSEAGRWHLQIPRARQDMERLVQLIPALGDLLPGWVAQGTVAGTVRLEGSGADPTRLSWDIGLDAIAFSSPESTYLGEGLGGSWTGTASRSGSIWQSSHHLQLVEGAALTPWFYLGMEEGAISLDVDILTNPADMNSITIDQLHYAQPGLLAFDASARLDLQHPRQILQRLRVTTDAVDLGRLYRGAFSPVLAGTLWERLAMDGVIKLDVTIGQEEPDAIALDLQDVEMKLAGAASSGIDSLFGVQGLNGRVHWYLSPEQGGDHREPNREPSVIRWSGGSLYQNITLGGASLVFNLEGGRFALDRPATIPVLDGQLQAELLTLDTATEQTEVQFTGYLTPISMSKLSLALGWPELSGQLSGMIPRIAYSAGALKVGGIALIKLFDGDIRLKNLALEELFGVLPVFKADIELDGLDLKTLTETFAFGKITGRLDGRIDRLRLENWQPVAFDARFATPADDRTPHRISQRAVDNLSNLGGAGISGALSRSFLRFFEDFGYSRLGISCLLENGVCHMGGVESAQNGYYLVKGGGIPRIDIMGFNRETDWDLLMTKLKQITEGEAPSIR